ncbi:unnamed protein product [Brassica oleracea var. botrytis]
MALLAFGTPRHTRVLSKTFLLSINIAMMFFWAREHTELCS